jgi:large subunit ribosomal protein L18
MSVITAKLERRAKIKAAIRRRIHGTAERPRLTVFRSNAQIYAQIVNDDEGRTLAFASSMKLGAESLGNKVAQATAVGSAIAAAATAAGVSLVVFDRNGYLYHGRVKALADAARTGGLNF